VCGAARHLAAALRDDDAAGCIHTNRHRIS